MSKNYWSGKKVLITGHTGFKGAWLSLIMKELGARVFGLALEPPGGPNLYNLTCSGVFERESYIDLRSKSSTNSFLNETSPEIVFHLAAQASVLEGYRNPQETWTSNVIGTLNLLEALAELSSPIVLVVATTDKVYSNNESGKKFVESDCLHGSDPYSSSKVAVEELISSYRRVFTERQVPIRIGVARAGNVIGGGDFMPDRIIPDAVRAISGGYPIELRNPESTRPWQHVLDPLSGYITLAEMLSKFTDEKFQSAFNFSNDKNVNVSVRELLSLVPESMGLVMKNIEPREAHLEAKLLSLDSTKSAELLRWRPQFSVGEAMLATMDWYRVFLADGDLHVLTNSQIREYFGNVN